MCLAHRQKRFYLQCKLLVLLLCCIKKKKGNQQGTKWGFNPFYHYLTEQTRFCKVLEKTTRSAIGQIYAVILNALRSMEENTTDFSGRGGKEPEKQLLPYFVI